MTATRSSFEKIKGALSPSRLLGGAVVALLIRVGSAGLSFAAMVLISRLIGPEAYGDFAVMLTLGSFVALAATLGMPTLSLRAIPQISVSSGPIRENVKSFVRKTYFSILAACILSFSVLTLASVLIGNQLALWAMLLVLPFALAEHQAHILRGLGKIAPALLPRDIYWYSAICIIGIFGTYILGSSPSAGLVFLLISIALSLLIVLQGRRVYTALRQLPVDEASSENSRTQHKINWTSEAFFLWLSTMSGAVQRHLSVVVAAPFLTQIETGAFFAAHRTALLLSLPLIAANLVAAPMIARAWAEGNSERVKKLCRLIVVGASIPALLGVIVIYLAGDLLLALFDPSYVTGLGALYVFTISSLINALCGPTGYVMLMTNNEKPFVQIQIAAQIASLLFTAIGAAYFGLIGAAVGAAFGTIGWNLGVRAWSVRNIQIDPTILGWLKR